jgi:MSHA biogenesis protein MshJ
MIERLRLMWIAIQRLRPREKALLMAIVVGAVWLLSDRLFVAPLGKRLAVASQHRDQLESEVTGAEAAVATLRATQQREGDPLGAMRAQIAKTRMQIVALDGEMSKLTAAGVVGPQDMVDALNQMLAASPRLSLVSLRNLPPKTLLDDPAAPRAADAAHAPAVQVFRHSVEISLTGSYLDTLEYLHGIEQLPWHLFWDEIDIQTEAYPQAKVRIVLSTLSLDEGLLGV